MSAEQRKTSTPRTIMIGGKAFATYTNAKRIVKLVNDVGDVVNSDPDVNEYLKVNLKCFYHNGTIETLHIYFPFSYFLLKLKKAICEDKLTQMAHLILCCCRSTGLTKY